MCCWAHTSARLSSPHSNNKQLAFHKLFKAHMKRIYSSPNSRTLSRCSFVSWILFYDIFLPLLIVIFDAVHCSQLRRAFNGERERVKERKNLQSTTLCKWSGSATLVCLLLLLRIQESQKIGLQLNYFVCNYASLTSTDRYFYMTENSQTHPYTLTQLVQGHFNTRILVIYI